uniref:Uncharacterized protein n=1 Tax=Hordeum vulgare subsp. vulgare TaxID=112509 RepID=A0A8I6XAQ8_HORVV
MMGNRLVYIMAIILFICWVSECRLEAGRKSYLDYHTKTSVSVITESKIDLKFCVLRTCISTTNYKACYCCFNKGQQDDPPCFSTREECLSNCPRCNPKCPLPTANEFHP